jgi:hypothetical protein
MNAAKIKTNIDVFPPALWQRNGRNMRGLIWMMSLVAMEEPATLAEVEKMKSLVRYDF